jgi:hypothetical protein
MSAQLSRQAYLVAIKPIVQPNHELLIDWPSRTYWALAEMGHVHTIGILTLTWMCAYPYPNNALRHIHLHTICMPMHSHKPVAYTFTSYVCVHTSECSHLTCVHGPCTHPLMDVHTYSTLNPTCMYSFSCIFCSLYMISGIKRHIEKCCPASGTGSEWYETGVGYQQPWDNFLDIRYSEDNAVFFIQCDFEHIRHCLVPHLRGEGIWGYGIYLSGF